MKWLCIILGAIIIAVLNTQLIERQKQMATNKAALATHLAIQNNLIGEEK